MRSPGGLVLRYLGIGLSAIFRRHLGVFTRLFLLAGDGENLTDFLTALGGVGEPLSRA